MLFTGRLGVARPGAFQLGNPNFAGGLDQTIHESISFSEIMSGANLFNALSESLTFTSSFQNLYVVHNRSLSDTLTFADASYRNVEGSVTESITLTDSFDILIAKLRDFTDTISFTATPVVETVLSRIFNESLSFNESYVRHWIGQKDSNDSLTFSEVCTAVAAKSTSDLITFSEVLDTFIVKTIHDVLDLVDTLAIEIVVTERETDLLELAELLRLNIVSRQLVSDMLVFTETSVAHRVKPVSDLITLTDVLSFTLSHGIHDTLTFSESLPVNKTLAVLSSDTVSFIDSITRSIIVTQVIEDLLTFNNILTKIYVFIRSLSDTVTFSDTLFREIHAETVTDTLTIAETLIVEKIATEEIPDNLILTDTLTVEVHYVRHPADTLTVVDNTFAIVADRYMYLVGLTESIALPPPEFNDYYANRNKTIIKRAMDGTVRTFNKTNKQEKLHYDFVLTRAKADELRRFLDAEHNNLVTVTDWRGYRYQVKLSNDSVDFTEVARWEPCGNKVITTLEFLGTRYVY